VAILNRSTSLADSRVFDSRENVLELTIMAVTHPRWYPYSRISYHHMPCFTTTIRGNTRNSSGDEIANVNFLNDDIVHVLQNTIDSCINSDTDRPGGYVLERMFTKFSEITQRNGHYAVQGHSRSPSLVPIESPYATSYK